MNDLKFAFRQLLKNPGFTAVAFLAAATALLAAPATGPLRVHPTNPRYFTDGSGKAIYLTGSHTWANFIDRGPSNPPAAFEYSAYLEFLRKHHHNFIRLWAHELFKEDDADGDADPVGYAAPFPWQRTGPGNAWDGKPKFDLNKFDQAFFDRLRARIIAAGDRGIYVGIMLFKGEFAQNSGRGHPFRPENNVNGINADANNDELMIEAHTLQISAVTQVEKAYIAKVIDTVNDLENVLYEISNESKATSRDWQFHLIEFIQRYQAGRLKQHPVGMTSYYDTDPNSDMFTSRAEWVSPQDTAGADYSNNPPAADGRKVILLDTDHLAGANNFIAPETGADQRWVWTSFLRGYNPILMDALEPLANFKGVRKAIKQSDRVQALNLAEARREFARRAMGHTLTYANRLNLAAMYPRDDLASTSCCLADPGKEYFVYQPKIGAFTVKLAAGSYRHEWFNPTAGDVAGKGTVTVTEQSHSFTAPFSGDAVLYLKLTAK